MRRKVLAWPADRVRKIAVASLLLTQAGLLAYSATRHSPTHLEPAFLVSGISHWQFGRFELYRVNPPLVRMVAALPVLAIGCKTDWSRYHDGPGSRAEFSIGEDFVKANGPASIPLFFYARWACIPFNVVGAYFAYRWAMELYQSAAAGLVTLTLYVFEPNLLAHGELITPDGACTAFGILAGYTFWRWLKQPCWSRALLAGGAMGLAELSKTSWLILFGAWPLLWLVWRRLGTKNESSQHEQNRNTPADHGPPCLQMATILLFAVYIINLCYAFDGFGTPLKKFDFVSTAFTGHDTAGTPGNRFRDTFLGELPLPLPSQYIRGLDSQKKDFEDFPEKSYLRGEWKKGGWWYYYLYGLLVKVPCGTWCLLFLVVFVRIVFSSFSGPTDRRQPQLRGELVLLIPGILLLMLASSQSEFNIHLRYVYPFLGVLLILLGFSGAWLAENYSYRRIFLVLPLIFYSVFSSIIEYPHHLSYFNDFVGGSSNGYKHLLGSSFDWGQDLLFVRDWMTRHNINANNVHFSSLYGDISLPDIINVASVNDKSEDRWELVSISKAMQSSYASRPICMGHIREQRMIGHTIAAIRANRDKQNY
jgi:hypothetical protein